MATTITSNEIKTVSLSDSMVPVSVAVSNSDFPSGSTLRTVELRVYRYNTTEYQYIEWGHDTDSDQTYTKDIHTCLQSLLGKNNCTPSTTGNLDILRYDIRVAINYLYNGVWYDGFVSGNYVKVDHNGTGETQGNPLYAIRGKLSDWERIKLSNSFISKDKDVVLSRKPSEAEIVCSGFKCIYAKLPKFDSTNKIQGNPSISSSIINSDTDSPRKMVVDQRQQYHQFCFINSLGVPETVCARTLESIKYSVDTIISKRSVSISNSADMDGYLAVRHTGDLSPIMEMSSGACSELWAEWWATEFLMAKKWWIYINSQWIPCTVEPSKKELTIRDKTKVEALHIDFTVTISLSGSNRLSVI